MQIEMRMTATELSALSTHEEVIERGLKTFQEVGTALLAIRDGRLYREHYGTFEDYCKERWSMSRSYAHRTIEAAQVVRNLLPIGNILPSAESQVRPLTQLEPEAQWVAWQEAVETAPNGKPTAAHVAKVVERYMPEPEPQFVLGEPKPYPPGDILPNGHATEYNPIRLSVTPVTQRPLSVTEGEAVISGYLEQHGKPEDLAYQRAMVESLIITDVQPLISEDRTITYDTFKNAKRLIAGELDRKIHAAKQANPKVNGMAVHFSSETPEHYTPQEVLDAVIACMGGIDLDPCSNSHESPNVPATTHYTQVDDGLKKQWAGRVYMNPPYGREIIDWVSKLVAAHESGEVKEAIALVPSRTDTKWWAMLRDYPVCLVSGRLKFGEAENGAPFPSAVFYLPNGTAIDRFYDAFSPLGDIWQRTTEEMIAR